MSCGVCDKSSCGLTVSSIIFAIIGLLHLYRLLNHVSITLGGSEVPAMASMIAAPVFLILAVWMWTLRNKQTKE